MLEVSIKRGRKNKEEGVHLSILSLDLKLYMHDWYLRKLQQLYLLLTILSQTMSMITHVSLNFLPQILSTVSLESLQDKLLIGHQAVSWS